MDGWYGILFLRFRVRVVVQEVGDEVYHGNELNGEPTNTVVYPSPRSANDD
jgi:hypothetical protein